jgi:hypothetical protein
MPISALFDINGDGEDHGYEALNGAVLALTLRDPSVASTVRFQVYDPAGVDESLGIAKNPPRASNAAPTLTLVGATSGRAVSPVSVSGTVTVAMPSSGSHSWIVRCIVNGGLRALPNGSTVVDPALIFERGVSILTGTGHRKIVATESTQFETEGWAVPINEMLESNAGSPSLYTPPGAGAVVRPIGDRLSEEIYVTDFMSNAEKLDAHNSTRLLDMQPAIQRAIDYALYRSEGPSADAAGPCVRLPGAVLRIDRPIQVGYGTDFRSIAVRGHGPRFGGNYGSQGSGTALVANFNDAPAVVVQGGRSVELRGFSIFGKNQDHIVSRLAAPTMANLVASSWVDPTFPAASSSRYAPYAGIAIDPYSGPRPAVSYPDVEYPDFLGEVPQYGKYTSSNTWIFDVSIAGFVVGIVQHPGNSDGNGDYTKCERVQINLCAYGYAWGNSQSRIPTFRDCTFGPLHTTFSTRFFGQQMGEPQVTCYSCSFDVTIALLDISTLNFGNGPVFYNCFMEAMYSLGRLGESAIVAGSAAFDQCQMGFSLWETYGVPTYVLELTALTFVSFRGCNFYLPEAHSAGLNFGSPAAYGGGEENGRCYRFESCTITPTSSPLAQLWQKAAMNATCGLAFSKGATYLEAFSFRLGFAYDIDTGGNFASQLVDTWAIGPRNRCLPVYARLAKSALYGADPGIPVAWRYGGLSANGAGGVVTQAGRDITFTCLGADANYLSHVGGDVGDVIHSAATGAHFWVYSRTGEVIHARAMSGYDSAGNLLVPIPNNSDFHATNCRRYCVGGVALYGNITSGSPTITGLVLGGNGTPDIPTLVSVNDYIYADADVDQFINPFGDNRIASIDNVAKTITMAGNFLLTRTRMRLGIFVRPGLPNGTATPWM